TLVKNPYLLIAYGLAFVAILVNLYFQFNYFDRSQGMTPGMGLAVGLFLAFAALGLCSGFFMLVEDVFRVLRWVVGKFTTSDTALINDFPSRRKFISQMALGIAAVPFLSLLYGMYKGRSE